VFFVTIGDRKLIPSATQGTGHLSPRGLHEGDLKGVLLYWGPRKIR